MKRFVHPLLLLLARATEKELVQMVEYLKPENRILRNKLPKRIEVTPAERTKLIKIGVVGIRRHAFPVVPRCEIVNGADDQVTGRSRRQERAWFLTVSNVLRKCSFPAD